MNNLPCAKKFKKDIIPFFKIENTEFFNRKAEEN